MNFQKYESTTSSSFVYERLSDDHVSRVFPNRKERRQKVFVVHKNPRLSAKMQKQLLRIPSQNVSVLTRRLALIFQFCKLRKDKYRIKGKMGGKTPYYAVKYFSTDYFNKKE